MAPSRRERKQSTYERVAAQHPPLTKEEEFNLSVRVQLGDARAKTLLFNHNVALVLHIAGQFMKYRLSYDDLVQEGLIGLMRAVEKFDPERDIRFSTYSAWWIKAYMRLHLKGFGSVVRMPSPASGNERLPFAQSTSLDRPVHATNPDGDTYLDRVADKSPLIEDVFAQVEIDARVRARVKQVAKRLGPVGMNIVTERLSEDLVDQRTLKEIGDEAGVSRERIRQLEKGVRTFLERVLADIET